MIHTGVIHSTSGGFHWSGWYNNVLMKMVWHIVGRVGGPKL